MTSSSKGCFGTYFKYRLGIMKMNFAMCCILNVLGLPLYSIAANAGFGGVDSNFAYTARVFSMICLGALPVVAVFNALAAFDYYHQKDLTDTIGALPLSHKQRFFGDLLAGLAVNAAPMIPCGIFCTIAFATMQEKLLKSYDFRREVFHTSSLGLYISAAVLLVVAFTYLFTALMSVCCGKSFHSVLFCVIAIAVPPLLFGGMARCFGNAILGIDSSEYFWKAVALFPPAGILRELLDTMDAPFSSGLWDRVSEDGFASFTVAQILVFVILAAGIIAGAYFLSKRRLLERTGSAFAIKPMFRVLSGGLAAAITASVLGVSNEWYWYDEQVPYPVISAAAGILVCLVTILFYPQKKKTFLKSLAVGACAVVAALAVWLVIDKTGAFGARYYPKNADKIEYIKINGTYTITDKKDIEDLTAKLNKELHDNPDDLEYGRMGSFFVEAKQTNGKSTARNYSGNVLGDRLFRSLDGYVEIFFKDLERDPNKWRTYLTYLNVSGVSGGRTWVSDEIVPELIQTLHEEAKEKHDPDAKAIMYIVFYTSDEDKHSFAISDDYTRTIALLTDTADTTPEGDSKLTYLKIDYSVIGEEWERLSVDIPFADKDDERVKELVSLIDDHDGEKLVENFRIKAFCGVDDPAVAEKNKARVLELMKELALDYCKE